MDNVNEAGTCYIDRRFGRHVARQLPQTAFSPPKAYLANFLTSFATMSQPKNFLLAPLTALFCTPFSKQWYRPLLRWIVEYTSKSVTIASPYKFWPSPIGVVWLRAGRKGLAGQVRPRPGRSSLYQMQPAV